MRSVQSVSRAFSAVPRRGYYQPPAEPRGEPVRDFYDGPGDGGISNFKDMLPDAQEARVYRERRQAMREQLASEKMSKDEFTKFASEIEARKKKGHLAKVPTTIEELPQSDQDWLAGKSKTHPLKHHPFVMKRARSMLAGSWIPAVGRNLDPDFIDEFKQAVNKPDSWIEMLDKWEGDYWDELSWVSPRMGFSRSKETLPYLKSLLRAMLRAKKGKDADNLGHLPAAMLDIVYDHQFIMGEKPDGEVWEIVMAAAVKLGEWRLGYMIEDMLVEWKLPVNADLIKQLDDLAQYAWDKGYMEPPTIQGRDLSDIFKIDTRGGVGAYMPIPRGESFGYQLFEIYEKQKKDGTFKPSIGSPAWSEFIKDKPELQGRPTDPLAALANATAGAK